MPQKPWLANNQTLRDRVNMANPYSWLSILSGAIGLPAAQAQMSARSFRWAKFSNLQRSGSRLGLRTHYLSATPEERYAQRRLLLAALSPETEKPFRLVAADTLPPSDPLVAFGPWDAYLDATDDTWKVNSLNWSDGETPVAVSNLTGVHYEDGPNDRQRAQVIEETGTNLVTNPSGEVDTVSWAAALGAVLTRVTTEHRFGQYSFECNTPGAGVGERIEYTGAVLAAGTTFSITAYVKAPVGAQMILRCSDGVLDDDTAFIGTGNWDRIEVVHITGAVPIANVIGIRTGVAIQDITFYVDGVQQEQTPYSTTYIDGSLAPGYAWTGSTHASTSIRTAQVFSLDNYVDLINGESKLTFRVVVMTPHDADVGAAGWPGAVATLFDARGAANTDRYILKYDTVNFQWVTYINGADRAVTGAQSFSAGDRAEVVLTMDFDADEYKIYVDGVLAATDTTALEPSSLLVEWKLGTRFSGLDDWGGWHFAEYDVWDKILTPGEISSLHAQGSAHSRARYLKCIAESVSPIAMNAIPTNKGDVTSLSVDEDVRWRSADGDFFGDAIVENPYTSYIDVDSDDYVMPSFKLHSTELDGAKTYLYRIDIFVVWKGPATNQYPINIKPGWDTTVPIPAKMQADGDDLRVWVDGVETKRWIAGINTATTEVWINLNFKQSVSSDLAVAAGTGDELFLDDVIDFPNSGMAYIDNGANQEVVAWSGKDLINNSLTGVKRGLRATAAFNHAINVTIWWMEHDVVIVYGDATATAPNADEEFKPMFGLGLSTNAVWQYTNYFGVDYSAFTRTFFWQWVVIKEYILGATTYPERWTANHFTNASPWTEMGQSNRDSGTVANVESEGMWRFFHPLGITNLIFQGAEKYSGFGVNMEGSVDKSIDGIDWTAVYNIANIAVPGVWENWAGLPRTVVIGEKWARVFGTSSGDTTMGLEVNDVDVTITDAPEVFDEGERLNYQIDLFIENAATGDLLKVYGNLYASTAVIIDTHTREVIMGDTGLRQNGLVTVYSEGLEWFKLMRGPNEITYATVAPGQVDVSVWWERRDFE